MEVGLEVGLEIGLEIGLGAKGRLNGMKELKDGAE